MMRVKTFIHRCFNVNCYCPAPETAGIKPKFCKAHTDVHTQTHTDEHTCTLRHMHTHAGQKTYIDLHAHIQICPERQLTS